MGIVSTLSVLDSMIPEHAPIDNITLDAMLPESRAGYLATRAAIAKQNSTLYAMVMTKQMEWERAFVAKGGLLMAGADPTVAHPLSIIIHRMYYTWNYSDCAY